MTQVQINTLNMFITVVTFLNNNSDQWNTNPVIADAVKAFMASVTDIQTHAADQQKLNKGGYTTKKDYALEALAAIAYRLALRVKNYAMKLNDPVLLQAVDFTKKGLLAGKENDVVMRCQNIVTVANDVVKTAPEGYKITPTLIAQVNDAVNLIEPSIADRNIIGGEHKGVTKDIKSLITTAHDNLDMVDGLIEGDADDDTDDFVHNYLMMRKTFDYKAGGATKHKDENGDAPKV